MQCLKTYIAQCNSKLLLVLSGTSLYEVGVALQRNDVTLTNTIKTEDVQ